MAKVSNEEYLAEAVRNIDMVLLSEHGKLLDAESFEALSRATLYIEKVLYGNKEVIAGAADANVLD